MHDCCWMFTQNISCFLCVSLKNIYVLWSLYQRMSFLYFAWFLRIELSIYSNDKWNSGSQRVKFHCICLFCKEEFVMLCFNIFCWGVLHHPPYLAPSDFICSLNWKFFFGGGALLWIVCTFKMMMRWKEIVTEWFKSLEMEVYNERTETTVSCYDKCLNLYGDYTEKQSL